MNQFHKKMLRQNIHENPLKPRKPIKRRARPTQNEVIAISSSESESDEDLEDVNLTGDAQQPEPAAPDPNDESDAFEDLEDVDLDAAFGNHTPAENETLTFTIQQKEEVPQKVKKFDTIPKEERHQRKLIHKLYIESMVAHGALRNQWCNDPAVTATLRDLLPKLTVKLLNEDWVDGKQNVLARRFILGLLKAQEIYSKKFKVTCQGLVRKDWGDMLVEQNHIERNVNQAKFKMLVNSLQGSRDVGAQGFVALLRSCGVHCRLVFSMQPPDFRSVLPAQSTIEKDAKAKKEKESKPRSEFDPVFIPHAKQEILADVRTRATHLEPLRRKYKFPMSRYPIFWAEAWNKFSRKWITIDPMVFECVEVMPMRKKSKFEPPGTEKTHQSQYILAFDKFGRVKDVTRRYTLNYNASVIKKRIDTVSDEDERWYEMVLRAASTSSKKFRQAEIYEMKEFYDRDVCEGIPKSKKGFKNHPLYALESEIRQDEVIYPKDNTSKCGTFKSVNKSTIEPIYKRSHVYRIRTAKAWHMRGRVLKMGALPLKSKKVNSPMPGEANEDDEGEVRLYAEFQTQLYIPPPIVDGKVTKNAYGNVEIYTSTMMPENGYLVKLTEKTSMKLLERAARDILRIDYARAIVAFDFGKKGMTTPREGGILIDKQFKDAMLLVVEGLVEIEEEEKRKGVELNALRCWKFFLAKLRIVRRLDREHGTINRDEEKRTVEDESNDDGGYFSVASDDEGSSEEDNYVPRKRRKFSTEESNGTEYINDIDEGGFIPEKENDLDQFEGGFVPDKDYDADEGGFVPDQEHDEDDSGFVPAKDDLDVFGGFVPDQVTSEDNNGGFIPNNEDNSPIFEGGGFAPEDYAKESLYGDEGRIVNHVATGNEEPDLNKSYGTDLGGPDPGGISLTNIMEHPKEFFDTNVDQNNDNVSAASDENDESAGLLQTQQDYPNKDDTDIQQENQAQITLTNHVDFPKGDQVIDHANNTLQQGSGNEINKDGNNLSLVINTATKEKIKNPEYIEVVSVDSIKERDESLSPTNTEVKLPIVDLYCDSNSDMEEQLQETHLQQNSASEGKEKGNSVLSQLLAPSATARDDPMGATNAGDSANISPQQLDEDMFDFDYSDSE